MINFRVADQADGKVLLPLRQALWPEESEAEHRLEMEAILQGEFLKRRWLVLLAEAHPEKVIGFAELSIRSRAPGCQSNQILYLEGWYVEAGYRRQGVGRRLVQAGERWGRTQGCTEFASDVEPENTVSAVAHRALGFVGTERAHTFRKYI
ncbi:MAG: GNAT family N-acetyltransferase [Planctomycetota bacterium]|nr:MAG: GNAT family N-acetyltransferase [Planctomycetota bacterium]